MAPIKNKAKKPTKGSEEGLRKKKIKDEAKAIVAELKRISQQPKRYDDGVSNLTGNSSEIAAVAPGNTISTAPKKGKEKTIKRTAKTSNVFKKNKAEAGAIVAKLKRISRQPTHLQDADFVSKASMVSPTATEFIIDSTDIVTSDVVNHTEIVSEIVDSTAPDVVSKAEVVLKTVNPIEVIDSTATVTPTCSTADAAVTAEEKCVYEIDCGSVSESVNVADVKKYLLEQLKVEGKKRNCGDMVAIHCRDFIVEIRSKGFLPKRYLLFLCKKFLKRNRNIRLVSKDKKSYELKYCGAP